MFSHCGGTPPVDKRPCRASHLGEKVIASLTNYTPQVCPGEANQLLSQQLSRLQLSRLQRADLDLAPANFVGALVLQNAVNLQTDKATAEALVVGQVFNLLAIDPCLNAVADSPYRILVPLTLLERVSLRLLGADPASACAFAIDIASRSAGLYFDLWSMNSSLVEFVGAA